MSLASLGWWAIPLGAFAGCAVLRDFWQRRPGDSITIYASVALIVMAIANPPWLLNNAVARFPGKISYSLYLYHVLARSLYMQLVPGAADGTYVIHGWGNRVAVIALSVAAASLPYQFVELPVLQWRDASTRKMIINGPPTLASSGPVEDLANITTSES